MQANIKITARQIRFVFHDGKVWAIQRLHVPDGVPEVFRGYYAVPVDEQQKHEWGRLNGEREKKILRQWVKRGFKL